MVAQALIRGQPHRHRLVTAVHRHQVDVEIEQQVRFGGALAEPHFLVVVGLAQHHHFGAVLGVEIVQPVGPVSLERPLADHPANLILGHAAMQRIGDNQVNVVNAIIGQRLQHHVKHPLAQVGALHLRQRQADVVDRDGDAHVGVELREERVGVFGMQQRVANRYVGIGQRRQAAAADRLPGSRAAAWPAGNHRRRKSGAAASGC